MIFLSFVLPYTQTAPGLPSRKAFWKGGARGGWERRTTPRSVLWTVLRPGASSSGNHADPSFY